MRGSTFDNAESRVGARPRTGEVYKLKIIEEAVVKAITSAIAHPEAIAAALAAYRQAKPLPASDAREELKSLDKALEKLRAEEASTIQAQIAGIRSGASPDAYAAVFADIALRRKDMENRRGQLSRTISSPAAPAASTTSEVYAEKALADTLKVLTAETITGSEKHDVAMQIVNRVVRRKDGAEVVFMPGLFGENQAIPGGSEAGESIVQTTWIVCKVRRLGRTWQYSP